MSYELDLLVTVNEAYLFPLQTMLTSLAYNDPEAVASVWVLHRSLGEGSLLDLLRFCRKHGYSLHAVKVEDHFFAGAPVSKRYPKEMYDRLLAGEILPKTVGKILYLDPDILILNSLRSLWETPLDRNLYAAAAHVAARAAEPMNQLRLGTETSYYNSGILLMNLDAIRREVRAETLFRYVKEHRRSLLLPDQDVLNGLYGSRVLSLPDVLWNYDARNYSGYLAASSGQATLDWVMQNTSILHFCGKEKPWNPHYARRFGALYKHYMQLARREFA